ncbi:MAG: hypothetical protein IGS39_03550 [Calothrix sp. C42_A2020_038]|nr:hypothetical protein [Calothrix sp. C42_A2020_038]
MAKRRLADLVQEEANKNTTSAQDSAPSVIDVTATPVEDSLDKKDSAEAEPENDSKQEQTSSKHTHLTKADLEVTVQELNELLAQVRHNEANLNQEVEKLQFALSQQQAKLEYSEQELQEAKKALSQQQTKLERSDQELQEAKKAAVQLAQANSELTEEINSLKQANAQLQEKQTIQQKPIKEKPALTKAPVSYKKSYGVVGKLQVQPAAEQTHSSDTSAPMWLLD